MLIVGFNAYHGDVAAAVVRDGRVVAALEEERFARVKHVAGFPARAIREALRLAGASPADVDLWAVARGRRVHLWPKVRFALTHRPAAALAGAYRRSASRHARIGDVLAESVGLDARLVNARLRYVEHHPAHLASAYYASGFTDAAVCALDGFGDFVSVSVAHGRGARLDVLDRVYFPHSLGILYLAMTQYLGFTEYGDEYKVMGLAPYGTPRYTETLAGLVHLRPHGRFTLDLRYFRHWTGEIDMSWEAGAPLVPVVYSERLPALLGPARAPDQPITSAHQDMAASLQALFETCVWHVLDGVQARVPARALCLAGGCAMNSVMNGRIRRRSTFSEIFVQPAAGDNGTALGAALHAWYGEGGGDAPTRMTHASLGTAYDDAEVARAIEASGAATQGRCTWTTAADDVALCAEVADRLSAGAIVGWFQGRMEWGARALGNRSILADPRRADMRDLLNQKIKIRERFRPFAPAVVAEALDSFFEDAAPDPFMLQVHPVRPGKRAEIPAVTHVDGTGRVQAVTRESNPLFWALLHAFAARTGVPVLLNTSFNENEPIVEHPAQALDCFLRTDMDVLAIGRHVLVKGA